MKKRSLIFSIIFTLMLLSASSLFSQNDQDKKFPPVPPPPAIPGLILPLPPLPDMTKDQLDQVKKFDQILMKEMLPLQNSIREKEAKLKTASSSEKVSMNDINSLIDEIGELKTQIAKAHAKHKQSIRNVLTEQQRLIFDSLLDPGPKHPDF